MYAWGSTINGELGLGGLEEEHILAPKLHEWALAPSVINAALGDNHTLFLLKDGKVFSCGSNDYGQLGHMNARKRPQLVETLTPHNIVSVACGSLHSMALNKWGQVFTWGSDINGQLGHQMGQELQTVPKLVKTLAALHVVQIAAGSRHSVALTNSGDIYCWGANNFGQCGQGTSTAMEAIPIVVSSLSGIPFATIACGANHTFAVSKSGSIFGWGKNKSGQLGLNDELNKPFPTQLKTMRNQNVRFVSCGEEFSAFLTADGGVFTCGAGMYGQLGHGTNTNEMLPRKISELMGSVTTQICCGRQHTLAFVPSRGRVYSFGLGGAGQLGLRKPVNSSVPQVVHGPWLSPSGNPVVPNVPHDAVGKVVKRMFAGGDHCFVTVMASKSSLKAPPSSGNNDRQNEQCDFREYDIDRQILVLQTHKMEPCLKLSENGKVDQELLKYLEVVFKNPGCINGSFLMPDKSHYYCTSKNPGIDLKAADRFFQAIARVENKSIKELIWHSVVEDLMTKLNDSPPDVEALRIYLILPLYHEFRNRNKYKTLHKPFTKALGSLKPNADRVVRAWWSMTDRDYFERLISIFKDVVVYILGQQKIPESNTVFYDPNLEAMLNTLAYLNKLNHSIDGLKVPYDTFHIPELGDFLDIRFDYLFWLSEPQTSRRLFLCNYPFIFNAHAKTQLLNTDQKIQMENAMQTAAQQAFISLIMNPTHEATIQQFLVLNVDRQNIVESTLRELGNVLPSDLKKPLKVKFHDEEAEDAGGVRKEFFMLLLRSILDPKYGMFIEHEETRTIWFSENTFEDDLKFFNLIGTICGLAIYNFTIIDIPFPLALYKKLLGEALVLSDLRGLSPTTASSLQQILDYEGSDFEEVFFGLHFDIDRHAYGTTKTVELRPNGSKIPVTQSNKKEYVDLYFKFILTKSIENQFNAFHTGFHNVCGGRVLKLFHSHELMAVVVGNENYDWHALEESAEYKGDYKSSDRTIRWFWEVVHAMSLADKKKFLLFLTGSYRIPIQGMKDIKGVFHLVLSTLSTPLNAFHLGLASIVIEVCYVIDDVMTSNPNAPSREIVIQPTNDEKYLPVAHTCFNLLDLPRYKTKERLRYKLMQAIQQTEGFSLV